jgi:biopolymer transport protein ExbD
MPRLRSTESVELNVTAMLDMAFQLLAFFVLTFKPPPGENQIFLKLPPARPVIGQGREDAGADPTKNAADVKTTRSVIITLLDENGDGRIATVQIGDPSVGQPKNIPLNSLKSELSGFFNAKDTDEAGGHKGGATGNYEQLVIQATPTLHWEDVLKVADQCTGFTTAKEDKIPSISFTSTGNDPGN